MSTECATISACAGASELVFALLALSCPTDQGAFGSTGSRSTRYSGFLLSLVSPVLHTMVCGAFKEGLSKRLVLGETEERAFETVLRLAGGATHVEAMHIREVVQLAHRLQMSDVAEAR